jgi:NAD(P)-dependent dehydrogenase (short-subunit alcohol dehydrogenase family)
MSSSPIIRIIPKPRPSSLPWKSLAARPSRRIVNISSGLARFALPGSSAYGAVKRAVEVLTRFLAKELGPRGIRVNTVAPGAIETDFSDGMVRDNPEVNKFVASGCSSNSLARGRQREHLARTSDSRLRAE